jgi:L-2-hydroxyglutarate oxidase
MSTSFDIVIVGGGIVGAATFYQLQKKYPEKQILLLEKEDKIGKHQTGRNSGVIHSGIYYKPGSLKAINCIEGRHELVAFAQEHHIPYDLCGKVIIATKKSELPTLETIYQRGVANKIEGISKITPEEIQRIEPGCTNAIAGIQVACTGIIDYVAVNQKLLELALNINPKSQCFMNHEVIDIQQNADKSSRVLCANGTEFTAKYLISCAGLQSDRIAQKALHQKLDCKIVPFRGDYYELKPEAFHKIKHLIYPVPNPEFPFLGVHFTRMIHGGVECGPNAVFSFKREGYSRTSFSLKDTLESLTYMGTWKLFAKHWKNGLEEYKRALSKRLFLKSLQELVPGITMDDIIPSRAGVRAQALDIDGNLVDDFKIVEGTKSMHIINAPSPAATASLAIGRNIAERYSKTLI